MCSPVYTRSYIGIKQYWFKLSIKNMDTSSLYSQLIKEYKVYKGIVSTIHFFIT